MPLHRDDYDDTVARAVPQLGTRNSSDKGSWPEPGERVTLLSVFRESCEEWYKHGCTETCTCARVAVTMALIDRHDKDGNGLERMRRWWPNVKKVLDRIEAEVRDGH